MHLLPAFRQEATMPLPLACGSKTEMAAGAWASSRQLPIKTCAPAHRTSHQERCIAVLEHRPGQKREVHGRQVWQSASRSGKKEIKPGGVVWWGWGWEKMGAEAAHDRKLSCIRLAFDRPVLGPNGS